MPIFSRFSYEGQITNDKANWQDLTPLSITIPPIVENPPADRSFYDIVATLNVPRPYVEGTGHANAYFGIKISDQIRWWGEIGYQLDNPSSHARLPITVVAHWRWENTHPVTISAHWRLGRGQMAKLDSYRALIVSVERANSTVELGVPPEVVFPPPPQRPDRFPPFDYCGKSDHGKAGHHCP